MKYRTVTNVLASGDIKEKRPIPWDMGRWLLQGAQPSALHTLVVPAVAILLCSTYGQVGAAQLLQ